MLSQNDARKYLHLLIEGIGGVAALAAAVLWYLASKLPVRDNIDTFIEELRLISEWNSYGALAASIAALCGFTLFLKRLLEHRFHF